ncbi:MAG: ABC transporter substrate-binding protein [Deltaproteobacteria bacterium]|nr:MAG: ABC transporter substrate-binding protein [Deltaproteobacteria bacterium]
MSKGFSRQLAVLVAAAAMAASIPANAADPIKIGVPLAQSPPGSVVQGVQVKDGLEIVKDMVNKQGGVNGQQITLIYEDDQGIPEKGRAAVEKLITRDKVVAIVGPHQSSNCLAEIEVAKRYDIPYVNTNCWSDDIRKKGYKQVFNPANYNSRVAFAMSETLASLGVKRVIAFCENTDYGIGQAKAVAEALKKKSPNVEYHFETLDRTSKDFTPAIVPLRSNPPDAVLMMMLPPAAYIVMNQLYEQGVAPSDKTWLYDGAGLGDYPDFWQNVKEAGKNLIEFGLYHPNMGVPKLGQEVGKTYQEKTKHEPNRLIYQAADSLLLVVEAIKNAKSTKPDAIIKALESMQFSGVRGSFKFSEEPGVSYHQWVDIPYVTYQFTEVGEPVSKTTLVQGPNLPLSVDKLKKAK